MLDPKSIRTRLAFIRYLHRVAVDQSQQPEPLQAASVLTFHDAVELFLHLAFEHCGGGTVPPNFIDYWDRLARAATPVQLSGKVSMDRLNRAGVLLKHHGVCPLPADVEGFRASVTSLFEDSSRSVFDLDFDLEQVEAAIGGNDLVEAGLQLAISFEKLLREYDVIGNITGRPFPWPRSSPRHGPVDPFDARQADDERRWTADSVARLASAVSKLALGLDYRRLQRFRRTTPKIDFSPGGQYWAAAPKQPATREDCEEGLAFVIDCALRVQ